MLSTASVVSAPSCTLRPATRLDAAFLTALRNELAEHFLSSVPATEEKTLELLAESYTYVVEVDGRGVGSFALMPHSPTVGRELEFGRFMVARWAQGRGYGRMLLRHAIEVARCLGATSLYLVAKPESVACGLYKDVGFEVASVRMELSLD